MRITGGEHRSRILRAPRGDATRPTSDRVREALFALLGSRRTIEGAKVLDLYAGTGALALEALSRGARSAVMVESSRAARATIAQNVASLGCAARATVLPHAVERGKEALLVGAPFDIVFADPPYALVENGAATSALSWLVGRGVLAEAGILVLEHGKAAPSPTFPGLSLDEARRYGDTVLALYFSGAAYGDR